MKFSELVKMIEDGKIKEDAQIEVYNKLGYVMRCHYLGGQLIIDPEKLLGYRDLLATGLPLDCDFQIKQEFVSGNLELRWTEARYGEQCTHKTMELVKWKEKDPQDWKTCYTIGYWIKESEGYSFKFVGSRFKDIDIYIENFIELLELGQEELDKFYKKEKENEM